MPTRSRTAALLTALTLALAGVAVLAGCGGGDGASSSTPVDQLLRQTFSGDKHVTSGKLDVSLRVESQGSSQLQGPVTIHVGGPFESQGKGKLPKFHLDASVQGSGQDIRAGLTSTGEKGFVSFQGTDYAVSDRVFRQFREGYEQAQAQAAQRKGHSLASLGIDPRHWLTNPRNAGEAKVGDADTIRITGGVDVRRLLDDLNTLLERTRSLGGSAAGSLPEKLTEQQKQQAADAVKDLSVDIYTGKDDKILRRLLLDLTVQAPQGSASAGQEAKLRLDVQLLDVNQGQDISAPANAKPFGQLLNSLNGLGLGGGSAGAGSGAGGTGSGGGGASADNLEKYSKCIQDAGNDASKARKCADLLTP
jgi:hypothetical protein